MNARRTFLRVVRPVTRLLDRINIRFGRPPLTGFMYVNAMATAREGDIVLTRTAWRPTNLFIPGRWSHAMMVVDTELGVLVEAAIPNARLSSMVDVWASCSEVKIVRPRFLDEAKRAEAAGYAGQLVGTPYDLEFHDSDEALYCSELIVLAMRMADSDVPSIGRMAYGNFMALPEDLADDNLFETVFDSHPVQE